MAPSFRLCDCGKLSGAEEPSKGALLLCCNTAADAVDDDDGG